MPDDDPRYEVDDAAMKARLYRVAQIVDRAVQETNEATGHRMGFGLFLFEFGPNGAMFWMSNADRSSMTTALREFLQREDMQ